MKQAPRNLSRDEKILWHFRRHLSEGAAVRRAVTFAGASVGVPFGAAKAIIEASGVAIPDAMNQPTGETTIEGRIVALFERKKRAGRGCTEAIGYVSSAIRKPSSFVREVLKSRGYELAPLGTGGHVALPLRERLRSYYEHRMKLGNRTPVASAGYAANKCGIPAEEGRRLLREMGFEMRETPRPPKKRKPQRAEILSIAEPKRQPDPVVRPLPYSDGKPVVLDALPSWFTQRDLSQARFVSAKEILRPYRADKGLGE